mmetsp:Transcript_14162/g.43807  ORF Transcript_14162/g.43807 Transcript_14162/m.43807 type:complete len:247 (+) Transcript_14162:442-1182(+)
MPAEMVEVGGMRVLAAPQAPARGRWRLDARRRGLGAPEVRLSVQRARVGGPPEPAAVGLKPLRVVLDHEDDAEVRQSRLGGLERGAVVVSRARARLVRGGALPTISHQLADPGRRRGAPGVGADAAPWRRRQTVERELGVKCAPNMFLVHERAREGERGRVPEVRRPDDPGRLDRRAGRQHGLEENVIDGVVAGEGRQILRPAVCGFVRGRIQRLLPVAFRGDAQHRPLGGSEVLGARFRGRHFFR